MPKVIKAGEQLPGPGSDEPAEDVSFRDLEGAAAAADTAGALPPVGGEVRDPLVVETEGIRDALLLARQIVGPMFAWWSDFPQVWSDAQISAIAGGAAAVMQKHGLSFGQVMSEYGPYVALGVALVPPCLATRHAIAARKAQLEQLAKTREAAARAAAQAPPAPAPGGHAQ